MSLSYVLIVVCTDSLSLYECLVKLSTTKEKRLIIDIIALRKAYERGELKDIRWINRRDNLADAITKATANASIEQLINTNELELRVQGWVNRATHRETTTSTPNHGLGYRDATVSTTRDTHRAEDIHMVEMHDGDGGIYM